MGPLGAAFAAVGAGVSIYGTLLGMKKEEEAAEAEAATLEANSLIAAYNAKRQHKVALQNARSTLSDMKAQAAVSGYTLSSFDPVMAETRERLRNDAMALEFEQLTAAQGMTTQAQGIRSQLPGLRMGGYLSAAGTALGTIGSIASNYNAK